MNLLLRKTKKSWNAEEKSKKELAFVEVKNVSMRDRDTAFFPDSVTLRGQKHLSNLTYLSNLGYRTAMIYQMMRCDTRTFKIAKSIDPDYHDLARQAYQAGVEFYLIKNKISVQQIIPQSMEKLDQSIF